MKSKEDPFPTVIIIMGIGIFVLIVASSSLRGAIRDVVFGLFVLAIIFMLEKIADGKT